MLEDVLSIFFQGVVIMFVIASTLLTGYSVQNKLRLRKVRLSWRAGKLGGYPLFSTVFLGLIAVLTVVVFSTEDVSRYLTFSAYLWIGCMWFISSYLTSKNYITDYGIVKNINEPSQTIPWFQIMDFVEREEVSGDIEYIFTYSELNKSLAKGFNKLQIQVPEAKHNAFKKIVSLKLGKRIEGPSVPDIDFKRIQED